VSRAASPAWQGRARQRAARPPGGLGMGVTARSASAAASFVRSSSIAVLPQQPPRMSTRGRCGACWKALARGARMGAGCRGDRRKAPVTLSRQLVRGEGRDVSTWYGEKDETCPLSTGKGGGERETASIRGPAAAPRCPLPGHAPPAPRVSGELAPAPCTLAWTCVQDCGRHLCLERSRLLPPLGHHLSNYSFTITKMIARPMPLLSERWRARRAPPLPPVLTGHVSSLLPY